MAITNRITVSSFRKGKIKKKSFCSHCIVRVFFFCLFVFPIELYHTVITKKKERKSTATLASCRKTTYTGHAALGKEIKARQRIQKYRKISHLFTEAARPSSIAPPAAKLPPRKKRVTSGTFCHCGRRRRVTFFFSFSFFL